MNWSTKLFFKINSLVGKNFWLDIFGRAGGEFAIFGIAGWYFSTAFIKFLPSKQAIFLSLAFLALAWFLGWGLNQLIGLVVKEKRPAATFNNVKQMFVPVSYWKAFPSDHTMFAFTAFFMALIFGLPAALALLPLALWVAWGRVFCGLHYPIDILGGITVAAFVSIFSWYLYLLVF